jgi:PAP2 superfamily protein
MATIVEAALQNSSAAVPTRFLVLIPPFAVCLVMGLSAAIAAELADISSWPLLSYFQMIRVTLPCVLLVALWAFVKAALLRTEEPLRELRENALERLILIILPAVILPAFLIGYTTSKTAIPLLVGYSWDGFWASADQFIFGNDAWRISRALVGDSTSGMWEYCYAVVWGTAFVLSTNLIALLANRSFVGVFFTAMMAAWLIGGCFMAYAFSAAGPVFAPMFDPSLAEHFGSLQNVLDQTLGERSIATAQHYLLVAAKETHVAMKGGGISAFPSMHIATVTIYVLAARGTKWLLPALAFWFVIFVASAYFGFHYWIDGIVSAALAVLCWKGSEAVYSRMSDAFKGDASNLPDHGDRIPCPVS